MSFLKDVFVFLCTRPIYLLQKTLSVHYTIHGVKGCISLGSEPGPLLGCIPPRSLHRTSKTSLPHPPHCPREKARVSIPRHACKSFVFLQSYLPILGYRDIHDFSHLFLRPARPFSMSVEIMLFLLNHSNCKKAAKEGARKPQSLVALPCACACVCVYV